MINKSQSNCDRVIYNIKGRFLFVLYYIVSWHVYVIIPEWSSSGMRLFSSESLGKFMFPHLIMYRITSCVKVSFTWLNDITLYHSNKHFDGQSGRIMGCIISWHSKCTCKIRQSWFFKPARKGIIAMNVITFSLWWKHRIRNDKILSCRDDYGRFFERKVIRFSWWLNRTFLAFQSASIEICIGEIWRNDHFLTGWSSSNEAPGIIVNLFGVQCYYFLVFVCGNLRFFVDVPESWTSRFSTLWYTS